MTGVQTCALPIYVYHRIGIRKFNGIRQYIAYDDRYHIEVHLYTHLVGNITFYRNTFVFQQFIQLLLDQLEYLPYVVSSRTEFHLSGLYFSPFQKRFEQLHLRIGRQTQFVKKVFAVCRRHIRAIVGKYLYRPIDTYGCIPKVVRYDREKLVFYVVHIVEYIGTPLFVFLQVYKQIGRAHV